MGLKRNESEYLNKRFGSLVITENLGIRKQIHWVFAECDCGSIKPYRANDIMFGGSTNCGCKRRKYLVNKNTTHGLSRSPLYAVWQGIKDRCYREGHKAYHRYGGRGITVCDEWLNDFECFSNWALQNGWQKGLEIDRENNDGNYSPDNCRVVTMLVNRRNTSKTIYLEYNGERRPQSEWAEIMGISYDVLSDRVKDLGWSVDKALTTPLDDRVKRGRLKKQIQAK